MARKLLDAREFNQDEDEALEELRDEAAARLRELWRTLTQREQDVLRNAAIVNRRPEAHALRRRGLLDEQGRLFGRVLTSWVLEEAV